AHAGLCAQLAGSLVRLARLEVPQLRRRLLDRLDVLLPHRGLQVLDRGHDLVLQLRLEALCELLSRLAVVARGTLEAGEVVRRLPGLVDRLVERRRKLLRAVDALADALQLLLGIPADLVGVLRELRLRGPAATVVVTAARCDAEAYEHEGQWRIASHVVAVPRFPSAQAARSKYVYRLTFRPRPRS